MRLSRDFKDYQILDMAHGEKLESWNQILLQRPDPQVVWPNETKPNLWPQAQAIYKRSSSGGGEWNIKKNIPQTFEVTYKDLVFKLKLMGFKHTGLFPEQAVNWDFIRNIIESSKRPLKVLNLFAYTGAASVAALKSGASVTHVDSSRGMVDWAKENVLANHLQDKNIRYLVDDCTKFVKREIRRGNKYDIILMDPPSFGRGSKSEVWNIEKDLYELVSLCSELMSDDFHLFMINSYSTGLSKTVLKDILFLTINEKQKGMISSDEIGLPMKDSELVLPCGVTAMWIKENIDISIIKNQSLI